MKKYLVAGLLTITTFFPVLSMRRAVHFSTRINMVKPLALSLTRVASPLALIPRYYTVATADTEIEKEVSFLESQIPRKILARFKKDYGTEYPDGDFDEHVRAVQKEWVRYAVLAKKATEPIDMLSKEVDNFWHTALLFTPEYMKFCEKLFGVKGAFLHHIPHDEDHPGTKKEARSEFIAHYKKLYGKEPNERIWLAIKDSPAECGCNGNLRHSGCAPLCKTKKLSDCGICGTGCRSKD